MCSQDKNSRFFLLLWTCLLCISVAGCGVEKSVPIATDNLSNGTPSATVVTPTVSVTVSPTMTPFPTITSTATPISIVLPSVTLSPQEAENALQELLKTNGHCTGKCLAGIRPDEMTVQEAVNQMARWGMLWKSESKDWGIGIHTRYLDPNSKQVNLDLDMILRPKSETTYGISFYIPRREDGEFLGADVWLTNRETWKAFQFGNLLKAYGTPSFVGFMMGLREAERSVAYTLYVVYEQMNLEIGIGGLAHMNGQDVFICPSKDPHSLGIGINPEVSGVPIGKAQEISPITWQALTNTDLHAFYQKFTDEGNPDACVTTTLEIIRQLDPYFR